MKEEDLENIKENLKYIENKDELILSLIDEIYKLIDCIKIVTYKNPIEGGWE
jgi:hypothetical protein